MSNPSDYSTWTTDDHIAKAETLASEADAMASSDVAASAAALRRQEIQQTVDRAQLHATLATLKRSAPASVPTPAKAKATTRAPQPEVV
ncbi:hypothetical protein [Lentzea cavernae]|uniref:Uncharacterized protein n=1 Tax=Lentzea cavernae TaxID=2020703 RepID=A0ABQ3MRH0_9PSEU|nr:hypothetical protein [Lentzea cavernae]GHH57494.1 hypothetical protein GCM10017774_77070 [Lentzea cavernae]